MVWVHNLEPVLLQLGPLQIRWYGLMYVLGFLFTYYYMKRRIKNKHVNMTVEQLDSLMTWCTLAMILGARLAEILLYQPSYYFANPWKMLAIWEGGLSFHGALVAMLLAGWLWCRKNKKKFLALADECIVPLALANSFGRIGNFINGELPGTITTLPWGIKFPGVEGFRHPSQVYEAAYDLVIFLVLYATRNKAKMWKQGTQLALFLIMYAVFRFLTEFVREPEVFVGSLTMGQFLNIFMLLAGLALLFWPRKPISPEINN